MIFLLNDTFSSDKPIDFLYIYTQNYPSMDHGHTTSEGSLGWWTNGKQLKERRDRMKDLEAQKTAKAKDETER